MRRILSAVSALALCMLVAAFPTWAKDSPTGIAGSFAWQDGDDTGRTWSATFDLNFPMTKHLSLGPALRVNYFNPPDGDSVLTYSVPDAGMAISTDDDPPPPTPTTFSEDGGNSGSTTWWAMGGQFTVYLAESHNGIHFGVGAMKALDDVEGYLVEPFVGLEFGNSKAFFRARLTHPYHYGNDGGDTVDLERNEITAGFGMRL